MYYKDILAAKIKKKTKSYAQLKQDPKPLKLKIKKKKKRGMYVAEVFAIVNCLPMINPGTK